MQTIPADTLKEITALRKENGLDASEAAAKAALETVKWTLQETPRYRRAGRSPIYLPGKFLTAKGTDPVTGETDNQASKTRRKIGQRDGDEVHNGRAAAKVNKVDEIQFYRVLSGKGFSPVEVNEDMISGKRNVVVPESIKKLALQFGNIPANAEGIYVTQTTPQIQISLPLEKFLELAGIKA